MFHTALHSGKPIINVSPDHKAVFFFWGGAVCLGGGGGRLTSHDNKGSPLAPGAYERRAYRKVP